PAIVAEVDGQDEQDRDEGRRAEAQVGALLVAELEQLPPVHSGHARSGALARARRSERRDLDRVGARAHDDPSGAAPDAAASAGACPSTTPSPSVSEKNRSSSVTVRGASLRNSAPASISDCDRPA